MKAVVPLLFAGLLMVGCASNPNKIPEPADKSNPGQLGMTKDEAMQALGRILLGDTLNARWRAAKSDSILARSAQKA